MARALLHEAKLSSEESLRIALLGTALHSPKPRKPSKCLGIEPIFRALSTEVRLQQFDLALQVRGSRKLFQVSLFTSRWS